MAAPEVKRMEPAAFIDTMARSLTREMDLRFEAGAASEFAEIAAIDGYVSAPKVDWERTSQRVLTTEWIEGRSLTNPGPIVGRLTRSISPTASRAASSPALSTTASSMPTCTRET